MAFQGGIKMIKSIKSMILSINLMEIGSFFPFFILIESAINIINAIFGYDMALLNGEFWYPANTFFSIIPVLFVSILHILWYRFVLVATFHFLCNYLNSQYVLLCLIMFGYRFVRVYL